MSKLLTSDFIQKKTLSLSFNGVGFYNVALSTLDRDKQVVICAIPQKVNCGVIIGANDPLNRYAFRCVALDTMSPVTNETVLVDVYYYNVI